MTLKQTLTTFSAEPNGVDYLCGSECSMRRFGSSFSFWICLKFESGIGCAVPFSSWSRVLHFSLYNITWKWADL